jgi:CO dehydrogenase/acetyl-CoA synthase delta subunit
MDERTHRIILDPIEYGLGRGLTKFLSKVDRLEINSLKGKPAAWMHL